MKEDHKPSKPKDQSRRSFVKKVGAGTAGILAAGTAPYAYSATNPIKWRLQTYSGAPLGAHVILPQIEAFKVAIDQVRLALEDDCAALTSSSVLQTLFTKSIGAAIHFNRSDSRIENDPEQGALKLGILGRALHARRDGWPGDTCHPGWRPLVPVTGPVTGPATGPDRA